MYPALLRDCDRTPASLPDKNRRGPATASARKYVHMTDALTIPENISIITLPAKCPELNPGENIWPFMRGNWLTNRVFESYDEIVDHCCDAWNKLIDQLSRIMSIGHRQWAQEF
jgi:hypothetical protein